MLTTSASCSLFLNGSEQGIHVLLPHVSLEKVEQEIARPKSEQSLQQSPETMRAILTVIAGAQSRTYILIIFARVPVALLCLLSSVGVYLFSLQLAVGEASLPHCRIVRKRRAAWTFFKFNSVY